MQKPILKPKLKKNTESSALVKKREPIKEWSEKYEIPGHKADKELEKCLLNQGYGQVFVLPREGAYLYQDHFNGSYEFPVLSKCVEVKGDKAYFDICDERNLVRYPINCLLLNNNVHFFSRELSADEKRLYFVPLSIQVQAQIKKHETPHKEARAKYYFWQNQMLEKYQKDLKDWESGPKTFTEIVEGALIWEGAMNGSFHEKRNLLPIVLKQWDEMKSNPENLVEWESVWGGGKAKYHTEVRESTIPKPSFPYGAIENCPQYHEYKKTWNFLSPGHARNFLASKGYEVHHTKNFFKRELGSAHYLECTLDYSEIHSFEDTWFTVWVFEEYRIFEHEVQISRTSKYASCAWEMRQPILDGGTGTSMESDGFWNK